MENEQIVILKSYCHDAAKYHLGKYKHWLKTVIRIDTTKSNGYAFLGDFLSVTGENEVAETDWILELRCGTKYHFYQAKDADQKDKHIIGTYAEFVTFRNACQQAMQQAKQSQKQTTQTVSKKQTYKFTVTVEINAIEDETESDVTEYVRKELQTLESDLRIVEIKKIEE